MLLAEAASEGPFDLAAAAARHFDRLDQRDRALAYELVVGTLKRRNTLDRLVTEFSRATPARTPAAVRESLRLGAYQLLYLDRVPAHAVVSDAVELAKSRGRHSASFVNAVLRRVAGEGRTTLERLSDGETPAALALRWSHPEWLVDLWLRELGSEQTLALLTADNRPAERCVRVNGLRATPARAQASLAADRIGAVAPAGNDSAETPEALVIEGGALEASAAFRDGVVTPQSRGSQLVARVAAGAHPAGSLLADLCAAPGTKTAHLAALLPGWRIVADDDDAARVVALRANLERLGVTIGQPAGPAARVEVVQRDVLDLPADPESRGVFDVVLLDAPCTGLGTLASRPDLRWRRRPADLPRLAAAQARLLAAAAALVAPGGALVYSVCTIANIETIAVVDGFLRTPGETGTGAGGRVGPWQLDDLGAEYPRHRHPENGACLQTLPSRDGTTGFFMARLRRGTSATTVR